MAPYHMSLGDHDPRDMSQDTSAEWLTDDDDDLLDEPPSLPVIPVPDILPTENSLLQLLSQACGDENLQEVTSVKLKVIANLVNLQRLHIYCPNLVELDLTGSHLISLRPLGYGLENLRVLRVGRCALTGLDGVFGVSGLRELYAPYNEISDLGLVATLPLLKILDMRSNPVTSLQQVGFLSMCIELQELTLAECPVADLPGYKACVVTTLPTLSTLDGYLLANGGFDLCQEGKNHPTDHPDDDDASQSLAIENMKIQENSPTKEDDMGKCEPVKTRRPATVSGARPSRSTYELPDRPSTAVSKRFSDSQLHIDSDLESMDDAVSKLTSGGIVCGNLAAALRGKHRQRKPAWTKEGEKDKLLGMNGITVDKLYTEMELRKIGAGDNRNTTEPLLAASRRWREAYHSFRDAHKQKWENEEMEERKEEL